MKNKSRYEQLFQSIHKSSTIILVGFMGSGKTTFGKELAEKLNYRFIDTDQEIEQLVGMSIDTLFKTKGEAYFRQLERQYLREVKLNNTVLSTGGGMPCYYDNMEYLNKIGVTVYLEYSSEELFNRLKEDQSNRPLLQNQSEEEMFKTIETLLAKRKPYYLKAQTIF